MYKTNKTQTIVLHDTDKTHRGVYIYTHTNTHTETTQTNNRCTRYRQDTRKGVEPHTHTDKQDTPANPSSLD